MQRPAPAAGLPVCHRALCKALGAAPLHPHGRPGAWILRATPAEDLTTAGLAEAMGRLAEEWPLFTGRLVQGDLVRVRPVSVVRQADLVE